MKFDQFHFQDYLIKQNIFSYIHTFYLWRHNEKNMNQIENNIRSFYY